MTSPDQLLAKGFRANRPPLTLLQHLSETEQAAVALFGPGRRWGRTFVRFFGLGNAYETFLLNLRVAALFHDLGKANADFHRAMLAAGFERQTLRHEHISAMVLHLKEVRDWLGQNQRLDLEAVTGAVLSHHLKAGPQGADHAWGDPQSDRRRIELFLGHDEVQAILRRVAELADLGAPPPLPDDPIEYADGWISPPWGDALKDGLRQAKRYRRELKRSDARRALLLATKAALIAADSVASALFREQLPIENWVSDVMGEVLTPSELDEAIIKPRLRSIGPHATLKDFQMEVARQGPRTLLLAACGSGKTLAAWAWARAQLETLELGRVVFLYPTRGTATEGFRDYVGWAPEGEGSLLHGSAAYELIDMVKNPPDSMEGKLAYDESVERLYSLGHWPKRYFSATTDQFLSFLEHEYRGLCMVPVIADAALVIDEVHSYDDSMFRSLLALLRHFDGPVLCMTATLPPERQRQLAEAGLRVFPDEHANTHLDELRSAEERPRYRLHLLDDPAAAQARAVDAYRKGQRVLYVVNTVRGCQAAAERLSAKISEQVLVYHSRFRLIDRKRAHEATIRAFQQTECAALAVTTQVCEMSLDIDADLLITEHAPVTSLVQRFGRANRKGRRDYAMLIAVPPPFDKPYTASELARSRDFLGGLVGRHLSQAELAAALAAHAGDRPQVDEFASFVTSGYFALRGDFRDIDELTDTAILDSDLERVRSLHAERRPFDAYLLPVPRRGVDTQDVPSDLPQYLRVAPASMYSTHRGFVADRGAA